MNQIQSNKCILEHGGEEGAGLEIRRLNGLAVSHLFSFALH